MNTISYKELKNWYLNNQEAIDNAKQYFGDNQPSIHQTGFYSSPSWNWGYRIGIVGVTGKGIKSGETIWFEVVTQFGSVVAAHNVILPEVTA